MYFKKTSSTKKIVSNTFNLYKIFLAADPANVFLLIQAQHFGVCNSKLQFSDF